MEGRILEANTAACALLGYSHDDLRASTLAAIRDPSVLRRPASELPRIEAGEPVSDTWLCRRSDGTTFSADVRTVRLAVSGSARYAAYLREGQANTAEQRAMEQRLEIFLNESPSVCFQKSVEGRYELINRRFANLFNVSFDSVVGKTDYDLFSTGIADAVRANDRQVAESGRLLITEEDVPSADGIHRYLSHKFPIRDAGGKVVSVAGIATDITAHRRAEERLRYRDQQLSVFFENNPAMCFQKDVDGRYELVNRQCADLFGMDAADSIGRTDADLFPAASAAEFRESDLRVLATGAITVVEHAIPVADGTRQFQTYKFPIRNGAGQIVGIAGIGTEITELKRAEAQLRASERRYRRLVELAPDAVLIIRDGRIALANSAAVSLFGASGLGALIGTSFADHVDAAGFDHIHALQERVLHSGQAPPLHDLYVVIPDGTRKFIEVSAARVDDPDGQAIQMLIRDQTERRRLEESLVDGAELERRRFGADLHDDLGQRLTAASLMLRAHENALESAGGDTAPIRKIHRVVLDALDRVRSLARGFAPDLEHGGLVPALTALADSCAERFHIDCHFDGAGASIADMPSNAAVQLYRVAQEAITNVARHANARRITIEVRRRRADVLLRIEDDGIGIPAGGAEAAEGMGIRSMRYRARLLGGSLTVSAVAGRGTIVECCCPLPPGNGLPPPAVDPGLSPA
jgi:PAS domain S-box-containing protein